MRGSGRFGRLSLERARSSFRDPSVFTDHVDESKFVTYTVTQTDRRFFDLMEEFSRE